MASSKLTWVYGRTHRAKDVSNEALDEYQGIIRHLYLNQNMTRDEVLGHLKHVHGFTLSPNQFSKATKRWGLYKQLRQDRTSVQAPKVAIAQESEQPDAVFDIEVDVSDAVGENENRFQTGSGFILDSADPENTENQFSSFERDSHDQKHRSIDHSQRQPPILEGQSPISSWKSGYHMQENMEMVIENQNLHRPMSPQRPQQRKVSSQSTEGSNSISPKSLDQLKRDLADAYDEKMCADFLACCYKFNDSFDCFESFFYRSHDRTFSDRKLAYRIFDLMRTAKSEKTCSIALYIMKSRFKTAGASADGTEGRTFWSRISQQHRMLFYGRFARIHRLIGSGNDKVQMNLEYFREFKSEVAASPESFLDMWTFLCLQRESCHDGIPDNLLDRLDVDEEEFAHLFEACLGVCKQWLESLEKKFTSDTLVRFDSIFLHADEAGVLQEISRLREKQSRLDTWQEAGFLFAFIWGNAQQEASKPSSWFKRDEISGISPTDFLAIICRMIVSQTIIAHPDLGKAHAMKHVTEEFISLLYLMTIEDFITKSQLSPRDIKREFLQHFIKHHTWSTLELEDNGAIKRVQKYQQAALGLVRGTGTAKSRTPVQEPRQTELDSIASLHTNTRMTNSGSLASSKATNSTSRSSSSSHARQLYLSSLAGNPTISRSLASGSSRGSSLNSFRRFQAASAAITIRLKEPQDSHMHILNEQDTNTWSDMNYLG